MDLRSTEGIHVIRLLQELRKVSEHWKIWPTFIKFLIDNRPFLMPFTLNHPKTLTYTITSLVFFYFAKLVYWVLL